jgi:hypothetical protein
MKPSSKESLSKLSKSDFELDDGEVLESVSIWRVISGVL